MSAAPKLVSEDDELIARISRLMTQITGVQLGEKQAAMMESRISKRIIECGLSNKEEYLQYIQSNWDKEIPELIASLTTHHTFFFREFEHFEYLEKTALPRIIAALRAGGKKHLRVWSAACSRGQECYSLSMFLSQHMRLLAPDFTYEIFGSDVDAQSVKIAENGVYLWDEIKEIPSLYLKNHWARGTGEIAAYAKARDTIKSVCKFATINLFQLSSSLKTQEFDIIFCRNVFIYFNPDQIKQIVGQMLKHLSPHGVLILGKSETLNGLNLAVGHEGPSIYCHEKSVKTAAAAPKAGAKPAPTLHAVPTPPATPVKEGPVRVFCVDDSPTILGLLKKMLDASHGFEIVGTAVNGLDAAPKIKALKPDVVTLDIHMPEQNGLDYLKANYTKNHPPVVMISSVSREDSAFGLSALDLGASDFIEKPSLSNLAQKSDEIRMKLRCASKAKRADTVQARALAQSFKRVVKIEAPDKKLRVIFASIGEAKTCAYVLKQFTNPHPATLIAVSDANLMPAMQKALESNGIKNISNWAEGQAVAANSVYLVDASKSLPALEKLKEGKPTSVIVLGSLAASAASQVGNWKAIELIVEDISDAGSATYKTLKAVAKYYVPYASISYHSDDYLCK